MSTIPRQGLPAAEVLAAMRSAAGHDANWRDGRTFSLVYHGGDELGALVKDAYTAFFHENGLSPMAFPSLRKFEAEVVRIAASLLGGGPEAAGTMTSGGSESVLMAVKTARDWARAHRPQVTRPQMLVPTTAHPAFMKAGHYFDVEPVLVPVGPDFRADVAAARRLLTPDTILVVGSAPAYPHGVIDPIPELAALAQEHGILCHTDACLGGFLLPWLRRLGEPIPPFDLSVPGVTSISADIHKYGFAAKGASTLVYRDAALRQFQFFAHTEWPGGLYGSPSMTGTRPGGAIAAAWAVLHHLGEEGYLQMAGRILAVTRRIRAGIEAIPGLRVLGQPVMSVLAFTTDRGDVYALGDALQARGWHLDRQQLPACLHLMLTPAHEPIADALLADLRACAEALAAAPAGEPTGAAAMYGMMAALPDRAMAKDLVLGFVGQMLEPPT
jgi:glutamate/tyrosine decarboxylase-like PLP-dependent enzyme